MKASEILAESPYNHLGSMPRKHVDGLISKETLARNYTKIGSINNFEVFLCNETTNVVVVPGVRNEDKVPKIFKLVFKNQVSLNFNHNLKNLLQVDGVAVLVKYEAEGIATRVYQLLVDHSFTIVSDIAQFDPAIKLWKRLASFPDYRVLVADVDHGYFKDSDGKVIIYNGKNIADSDIWTTGSNLDGEYRVLILTK